jgi:hypothetical protein
MLNLFFIDFKIGHYLWARKVVRKFVAGERQTTQNDQNDLYRVFSTAHFCSVKRTLTYASFSVMVQLLSSGAQALNSASCQDLFTKGMILENALLKG